MNGGDEGKPKDPNGLVIFVVHIAAVAGIAGLATHCREEPRRFDNTVCANGTRTISSGQGACSWHGGVRGYVE
jgi:hypothetical protein